MPRQKSRTQRTLPHSTTRASDSISGGDDEDEDEDSESEYKGDACNNIGGDDVELAPMSEKEQGALTSQ